MAPKMTIYVPDDLAEAIRKRDMNVSAVCQKALREEVDRMELRVALTREMEQIEVDLWASEERPYTATFTGRWLVFPDRDETRTTMEGYDAGAYYGVALTEKGNFAVYVAHCNDGFEPTVLTYASLGEARKDGIPGDVLAAAAMELGEDFVVELDI